MSQRVVGVLRWDLVGSLLRVVVGVVRSLMSEAVLVLGMLL